jgi:ABC-type lipoprotein release transport system permease subunit
LLRALRHYWRINLAVLLGAAVASTVLSGALLVGSSVRGSLQALVLERLGGIDAALVGDRFFGADLAERVEAQLEAQLGAGEQEPVVVAAILSRGSAVAPDSGRRASQVGIHGVDEGFEAFFEGPGTLSLARGEGQVFPSVAVNAALAEELEVQPGDPVLLSFGLWSQVPRDTLMGEKDRENVLGSLRLTVSAVLPDRGAGRFGLSADQHRPLNAFVALPQLQRGLDQRGRVNALLVGGTGADPELDAALARALTLDDVGLRVERAADHYTVESREFVLRPAVERAVDAALARGDWEVQHAQSYLLNEIRAGDRAIPYALVAAVDRVDGPPWARLVRRDGGAVQLPADDGILLNRWAAEDLGVAAGDTVGTAYYVVDAQEQLRVERSELTVAGVVELSGLGNDRGLTPDYPGIQEAEDIASWDPPFPVDLDAIRPTDEDYWDRYGATPKAFLAASTGRELWSTRYGTTTSVRFAPRGGFAPGTAGTPGAAADEALAAFRRDLLDALPLESFGLAFRAVKRQGLAASDGSTDFSGLFIGFSMFLIASAAMLVGLLFGLGVEQRAREIGLLLAVGYRLRKVRLRLLGEGALLAAAGGLLGLAGGIGYAWLLMAGLRTIWVEAVGSSELYLYVEPFGLALGWGVAVLVVLFSIWLTTRRLRRIPPPALLAGTTRTERARRGSRWTPWIAWVSGLAALSTVGWAVVTDALSAALLAFGAGTLLLIAGLAAFSMWCRGSRARAGRSGRGAPLRGLAAMAARNSAWNPGRSILSVGLVASACFVIVALSVNREELGEGFAARDSGSGGFSLIAEADVPLHQDLGSDAGRFDLGFSDDESAALSEASFFAFRLLPGDDASCLNLYAPQRPRLLGAPEAMIRRGGFSFKSHLPLPEGAASPWELLESEPEPGVVPAVADYNSAMWILKLGLGKDLVMEDERGEPLRLRLVGLLDTSILQSEMVISERAFLEHFPSRSGYAYFLAETPPGRTEEVATLLESRLGAFGFDTVSARQRLEDYKAVEHTYIATFQLLGGLGLLLGTLGLAIILVRNVIERRGELAVLRAFGFRRGSLARIVLLENAFLLATGTAVGTLAALLAVLPRLVRIHASWGGLALTLAAVLVVGMGASVAAVRGAMRTPLVPALKQER